MKSQDISATGQSMEADVAELSLTENQRQRVDQIVRELAMLMDLPEVPRIAQAAHDMLRVFVVDGGIPIDQAIDTLAISLTLTQARMSRHSPGGH